MGAQFNIDNIILEYFNNKKDGFFVEVGVCDPIDQNNTYLLEKNGWKGILIEPLTRFNDLYAALRPNSIVENFAMVSKDYPLDYIYFNNSTGIDGGFTSTVSEVESSRFPIRPQPKGTVKCDTLENILIKNGVKDIDFLTIDVEGYEINVMNGIDISKFNIEVILIESHNEEILLAEFEHSSTINSFDYLCEYYDKQILSSTYHILFTKKVVEEK